MKAVIIEDEDVAARALESLLRETYPDIEIPAVLQSVEDSVEWFTANPMPDLAFMDIHLSDDSSFAIFERVEITCPIVFTTAYDQYALKAFEVNSIDYLLKPISEEHLRRAIGKLSSRTPHEEQDMGRLIGRLLADMRPDRVYKSSLLVAERDKLIPLPVKDIAYIYICQKVVTAVSYDNRMHVLDQNLDELTEVLNPHDFYRANRQFIISRAAVKNISTWFGSKLSVNLVVPTPERIQISKARAKEFKSWITE